MSWQKQLLGVAGLVALVSGATERAAAQTSGVGSYGYVLAPAHSALFDAKLATTDILADSGVSTDGIAARADVEAAPAASAASAATEAASPARRTEARTPMLKGTSVPEPASLVLIGSGLAALVVVGLRRRLQWA